MFKLKPLQKKCISIFIGNLLLAPVLTQAATITVNTTDDPVGSRTDQCSLRIAIDIINRQSNLPNVVFPNGCVVDGVLGDNDEINFDLPDGSNTITLDRQRGQLSINSTVSINGPGADLLTIDANQASRVMNISGAANSTIDGLTITGGRRASGPSGSSGAGIMLTNSDNTVLSNLDINNNITRTYNSGGGVAISSSDNVILDSVKVSDNIANYGGGLSISLAENLTIIDSEISNNLAENDGTSNGATAGGIQIISSGVTIENSTISGNSVLNGSGGGLRMLASNTVINRSTISNNRANEGGGISASSGSGSEITSTVIKNSTISGNSVEESGYSNSFDGGGGAIIRSQQISFHNVTVTDNSSTDGGGGLIIGSSVAFDNTVVANNAGGDCAVGQSLGVNDSNWFGDDSCNGIAQGDPLLGLLSDNGGPTLTHAPLPNSGLIDAGSLDVCQTLADGVDQRNEPRGDTACFIGAVETIDQSGSETLFVIPLENDRTVIFGL